MSHYITSYYIILDYITIPHYITLFSKPRPQAELPGPNCQHHFFCFFLSHEGTASRKTRQRGAPDNAAPQRALQRNNRLFVGDPCRGKNPGQNMHFIDFSVTYCKIMLKTCLPVGGPCRGKIPAQNS